MLEGRSFNLEKPVEDCMVSFQRRRILCSEFPSKKKLPNYTLVAILGISKKSFLNCKDICMNKLQVGSRVTSNRPEAPLVSGAEVYGAAVCVSVDPFVLVSHTGDMRWGRLKAEHFDVHEVVDDEILKVCMRRLEK